MKEKKVEPFRWPKATGAVPLWMLRSYAAWLFPQMDLKWQAKGVRQFDEGKQPDLKNNEKDLEPYEFPRTTGACLRKDLLDFARYVIAALPPLSRDVLITDVGTIFEERTEENLRPLDHKERPPYVKREGVALVEDLKRLDVFFTKLLKEREKPQENVRYEAFG